MVDEISLQQLIAFWHQVALVLGSSFLFKLLGVRRHQLPVGSHFETFQNQWAAPRSEPRPRFHNSLFVKTTGLNSQRCHEPSDIESNCNTRFFYAPQHFHNIKTFTQKSLHLVTSIARFWIILFSVFLLVDSFQNWAFYPIKVDCPIMTY